MANYRHDYAADRKVSQYPRSGDVVDMEVDCVLCKSRLYVPYNALDPVLASFRRVGGAVLICHVCGMVQLVSGKIPQSPQLND
jgi:hypothetical protein